MFSLLMGANVLNNKQFAASNQFSLVMIGARPSGSMDPRTDSPYGLTDEYPYRRHISLCGLKQPEAALLRSKHCNSLIFGHSTGLAFADNLLLAETFEMKGLRPAIVSLGRHSGVLF